MFSYILRARTPNTINMAKQPLIPDQDILSSIFPDIKGIEVERCNVISNTFDTCTFSIKLDAEPRPGYPKHLLIRLEASGGRLAFVAALQQTASSQLPRLVPSTLDVGNAMAKNGKQLEYSVTTFFDGTTTLDQVWNVLDFENQQQLVDSVVDAIEKLQSLPAGDGIPGTPLSAKNPIGGPELGCFSDIAQFLGGVLRASARNPHCTISSSTDGVVVQSAFNDVGRVELTNSDLDILRQSVVFCHGDLEPRNLLVKPAAGTGRAVTYELAAIIDWEMAGFFPFAYEYGIKDTYLGSSNLWFNWYSLFKSRTAHLLPEGEAHTKMIEALRVITTSRQRNMTRNVGVRVQSRWIAREMLELSPDIRLGWVRKDEAADMGPYTKEDNEALELEVLKELGII